MQTHPAFLTRRQKIERREAADAVQLVVDGDDLDRGRVSRLEFLANEKIVLDVEDIDALLSDGDSAERVRRRVEEQVEVLTRAWLETPHGRDWLRAKVDAAMEDEYPEELEDHGESAGEMYARLVRGPL